MNKQLSIFPGFIPLLLIIQAVLPGIVFGSEGFFKAKSYSPGDYGGATQNWDMVQDSEGRIMIANRDGVLVYDGFRWNLVGLPNPTPLRSLGIDENDRVYVGAAGQFGYLAPDSLGALKFVSLSHSFESPIGDVWETHVTRDGVVFATRSALYVCEDTQCELIETELSIARTFYAHNILLVSSPGNGIAALVDGKVVLFIDESQYNGGLIHSIVEAPSLPGKQSRALYLFNRDGEAYYHDIDTGQSLPIEQAIGHRFTIPPETYRMKRLQNGGYAFGTISSGIHLTDAWLRSQGQITRDDGLRVDMVLSVAQDRDGNIWAMLNNGITRIVDPFYTRFWNDDSGIIGTILHLSSFRGDFVASTSSGIYIIDAQSKVTRINQASSQMWQSITITIDDRDFLLTAGNLNLLWWDGRQIGSLHTDAFRSVYQSPNTPGRIFVGTLNGWGYLDIRVDANGRLQVVNMQMFSGPAREIRGIYEEADGTIWLQSRFNGIFLTRIPADDDAEPEIRSFTYDFRESSDQSIVTLMHNLTGEVLFTGPTGFMEPDTTAMHFSSGHNQFDDNIHGKSIQDIKFGRDGELVILFMDGYGIAHKNEQGIWTLTKVSGLDMPDTPLYGLYAGQDFYWVGGAEGLYRFSRENRPDRESPFQAVIGDVFLGQDSLVYGSFLPEDHQLVLEYGRNQLRIEFGATRFHRHAQLRFESKLEGFDSDWSPKTTESRRIYTNIPDGRYTFRVRATDIYGVVSQEDTLQIYIPTPWFKSWAAYIGYFLLSIVGVFGVVRLRTEAILRKNRELELLIAQRTASLQVEKRRLETINEDLKMQDEHKEMFLSVVAHDLRNPLMIIISSVDLIQDDDLSREELEEFTGYIRDAALRMQQIIETLLEDRARKIRSVVGENTEVRIASLVEQVVREHKQWSDRKQITIDTSGVNLELTMQSDAAVAGVILSNLLSNAIKYSHEGKRVWISADSDETDIRIAVSDEGQGLTTADLRDIGKPFKKLSARPTHGEASSGLGLHIVNELINDLGGNLQAFSEGQSKGARFEVRFPIQNKDA